MFKLRRFIIEYGSEKNFQSAPETLVRCKTKEEINKKNFIIFLFPLLFFVKHKCPYMIKWYFNQKIWKSYFSYIFWLLYIYPFMWQNLFIGPRSLDRSDLWVEFVCHWVSHLRLWNFTDVTPADEDTNWILTNNDKKAFQGNVAMWLNLVAYFGTLEVMSCIKRPNFEPICNKSENTYLKEIQIRF